MNKDINLIYGKNPVIEAINAKKALKVFLVHNFNDQKVINLIKDNKLPVVSISSNEMEKMCDGGVHQGLAAELKPYQTVSLEEIIIRANKKTKKIIVMLDNINDPHNLGAILRSADVFEAAGIVLPKHNSVSLNATVAKTSAGAINYVPVAVVNNLNQAIKTLKEEGYWVVSTDGSATIDYSSISVSVSSTSVLTTTSLAIASDTLSSIRVASASES